MILVISIRSIIDSCYFNYLKGRNYARDLSEDSGEIIYTPLESDETSVDETEYQFTILEEFYQGAKNLNKNLRVKILLLLHHNDLDLSLRDGFVEKINRLRELTDLASQRNIYLKRAMTIAVVEAPTQKDQQKIRNTLQIVSEDSRLSLLSNISTAIFKLDISDRGESREQIMQYATQTCSIGYEALQPRYQRQARYDFFPQQRQLLYLALGVAALLFLLNSYDYAYVNPLFASVALALMLAIWSQGPQLVGRFNAILTAIKTRITRKEEQIDRMIESVIRVLQECENTPRTVNQAIDQVKELLGTLDTSAERLTQSSATFLDGTVASIRNTAQAIELEVRSNGIASAALTRQMTREIMQMRANYAEFLNRTLRHNETLARDIGDTVRDTGRAFGDAARSGAILNARADVHHNRLDMEANAFKFCTLL